MNRENALNSGEYRKNPEDEANSGENALNQECTINPGNNAMDLDAVIQVPEYYKEICFSSYKAKWNMIIDAMIEHFMRKKTNKTFDKSFSDFKPAYIFS